MKQHAEKRWHMVEDGKDHHALPSWEPRHAATPRCYCCPVVDYEDKETGDRIWKHHTKLEAN